LLGQNDTLLGDQTLKHLFAGVSISCLDYGARLPDPLPRYISQYPINLNGVKKEAEDVLVREIGHFVRLHALSRRPRLS
jgi:hypothetical protein